MVGFGIRSCTGRRCECPSSHANVNAAIAQVKISYGQCCLLRQARLPFEPFCGTVRAILQLQPPLLNALQCRGLVLAPGRRVDERTSNFHLTPGQAFHRYLHPKAFSLFLLFLNKPNPSKDATSTSETQLRASPQIACTTKRGLVLSHDAIDKTSRTANRAQGWLPAPNIIPNIDICRSIHQLHYKKPGGSQTSRNNA